ncbi:MAG: dCTP deaminase [Actinomycetota bacterium]|nr:dCTP deaminase [Actinomycetota bacterium]MDQ2957839.1 dCTP deaminase [Actinomycetota bacterium]
MILSGNQIVLEQQAGRIVIDPFDETAVNPNSYNFTLSDRLIVYSSELLDASRENLTEELRIPPEGLQLKANKLYLAATREVMGSEHYAPTFAARSSVARLGLFINLSAPLGDIGFIGRWTLQLYATHDVIVYEGMQIGQMMWWKTMGDINLYDGKYQHADGPRSSMLYRSFG